MRWRERGNPPPPRRQGGIRRRVARTNRLIALPKTLLFHGDEFDERVPGKCMGKGSRATGSRLSTNSTPMRGSSSKACRTPSFVIAEIREVPARRRGRLGPQMRRRARGDAGKSFKVAAVITPSVPSEPIISRVKIIARVVLAQLGEAGQDPPIGQHRLDAEREISRRRHRRSHARRPRWWRDCRQSCTSLRRPARAENSGRPIQRPTERSPTSLPPRRSWCRWRGRYRGHGPASSATK